MLYDSQNMLFNLDDIVAFWCRLDFSVVFLCVDPTIRLSTVCKDRNTNQTVNWTNENINIGCTVDEVS